MYLTRDCDDHGMIALLQVGNHLLGQLQGPKEVRLQCKSRLFGERSRILGFEGDRGIVDEDVDLGMLAGHRADERGNAGRVSDVQLLQLHVVSTLDQPAPRLQAQLLVPTGEDHLVLESSHASRDLEADAFVGPGYDANSRGHGEIPGSERYYALAGSARSLRMMGGTYGDRKQLKSKRGPLTIPTKINPDANLNDYNALFFHSLFQNEFKIIKRLNID